MAEFLVVSEQDIRKKIDLNGLSFQGTEDQIRAVLEKMGVDFGRTVHCQGDAPNRKWSNNRNAFQPVMSITPEEPVKSTEPSQGQNEIATLRAELAEIKALKAQIAQEKALMDKSAQSEKPYSSVPVAKKV